MAPKKRRARGPAKRGSRSGGRRDREIICCLGACVPLRGRIFLWKALLRPPRSRSILLQPIWDGALQAVCFVRLLAKGRRPGAWHEGPRGAGIGQRRGCRDCIVGAPASRYGVASSFGRYCSALRGRIRVVAFRASHPTKPSSRPRGTYS